MHAPLLALEVVGALAVDLDIDRDQLHLRTGIDRVGRTPVRRLAFELGIDERVVVPEWPQRLAQLRTGLSMQTIDRRLIEIFAVCRVADTQVSFGVVPQRPVATLDRKSTRLNSSHYTASS